MLEYSYKNMIVYNILQSCNQLVAVPHSTSTLKTAIVREHDACQNGCLPQMRGITPTSSGLADNLMPNPQLLQIAIITI